MYTMELQSTGYVSIYSGKQWFNYDGAYDVTGAIFLLAHLVININ